MEPMNVTELEGFQKFCGGVFWDIDLTWNTGSPDFTSCFQETVLVWAPAAWLWVTLIPYACYLNHVRGPALKRSKLFIAKLICFIMLLLITTIDFIDGLVSRGHEDSDTPLVRVVSPAIEIATFILAIILMNAERRKGFITSGILFIYLLLGVLCGIIPFYSQILNKSWVGQKSHFITFYFYYFFLLLEFFLFCFAEKKPPTGIPSNKKPCPETQASFLSRITFNWLNQIVLDGYKKDLVEDEVWVLNPRDMTKTTAPGFEREWYNEMLRAGRANGKPPSILQADTASSSFMNQAGSSEKTPLLGAGSKHISVDKDKDITRTKEASLFKTLFKVYGPTMLIAWACKLVCDILTFIGPTLQSLVITYTSDPSIEEWKGYLYASLFFVNSVVTSFFFHQLFHIGMTLGMRVKAALIDSIYKKALTMSNDAKRTSTVGEIVNLMSVDAQRMQDVFGYLWMVWSCPLQIIIAVYLLWGKLGASVLAGLGVMLLLIPLNGVMATYQRKLQIAQMTQKDQRIKLMNEVLNGMKVLKLYAWELSFRDKVAAIRNMELATLQKYAYLSACNTFTWTCAPFLVILATFTCYVLTGGVLDAERAFVSLSLFNILRFPINMLPMMISYLVTASVSIKRIGNFLQHTILDEDNVQHDPRSAHPITVRNGTFAWGTTKDDPQILRNIDVTVKDGSLLAVVGQVGAGKSSLISAFLGEMEKLEGQVNIRGSVAYVAQQAWIQNATLKDNILFGKELDEAKYQKVLEACALIPDLEILPGGDMTEIGEKGINLSGGQKQRVSLARAVYSDSDVYLLDDPLSAVDAHVGKHIFEKVVGEDGMLGKKTRVLVTHGIHWLPNVDQIIVMLNGEISETGNYDELLCHNGAFAQFLKAYLTKKDESDSEASDPELQEIRSKILERVESLSEAGGQVSPLLPLVSPQASRQSSESGSIKLKSKSRHRTTSALSGEKIKRGISRQVTEKEVKPLEKEDKEKLIKEEVSASGQVKMTVFLSYCRALGLINSILILIFFLLYQVASVYSSVWLSLWTDDEYLQDESNVNKTEYADKRDMYLGVYGGLGVAQAGAVLVYAIITAYSMVRASRKMHASMLYNILRSPMVFFDTTPIGRILNRFSRDIETIDNILPQLFRSWMNTFFSVCSTVIVISYSTPIFLSVVLPLGILYYLIQRFYIPTSRQLKRIESTSRSPIYIHFSETITGASTIRAFNAQQRFIQSSEDRVDHNLVFYFASIASNRWLGFRLECLGALIVLAAAMFAVLGRHTDIDPGIVGLSLSYALQVTAALNWMVRMTCDLETNIVSVERVIEYTETETEGDWQIAETRPPSRWPDEGKVAYENYSTRYREGLDLVLRGITVDVKAGEKVGIVGRTGAGKSSLTLSLFRIIEAAGGSIIIDGIPISTLGLHQLRSKLTILPQDPVLFSGTMRMNLDPIEQYSDDQLWQVLEHAHLKKFVESLAAKLDYECGEGGLNLSVGQRQLVCLARTLLRKTKILILDEATAAVDLETDELIQTTIRTEFADCTVLTIAHRINTIMDNDKVIVLDNGNISEYDTPARLLEMKGAFYAMAKDAGLVS